MPITPTLDPIGGLSAVTAAATVAGLVPDTDYQGLDAIAGSSDVQVKILLPRKLQLDPIDGITVISLKNSSDLGDGTPINVGFFARCHAILLPPVAN